MKYRKGDVVSVTGTVTHDQREDKEVFARLDGYYTDIMLPAANFTLVQPRFDVGETVSLNGTEPEHIGTILAISDDHAWIILGSGDYCTRMLLSIKRVEPETEA